MDSYLTSDLGVMNIIPIEIPLPEGAEELLCWMEWGEWEIHPPEYCCIECGVVGYVPLSPKPSKRLKTMAPGH